MKTCFSDLESNLVFCYELVRMNATHLKTLRLSTISFTPYRASYRVHICTDLVGKRLRRYSAVDMASAQSLVGKPLCFNIHQAISTSVLFLHSVIPFCSSVYGAVNYRLMPFSSQNVRKSPKLNSPPQSVLSVLTDISNHFSTTTLNILNFLNACHLV